MKLFLVLFISCMFTFAVWGYLPEDEEEYIWQPYSEGYNAEDYENYVIFDLSEEGNRKAITKPKELGTFNGKEHSYLAAIEHDSETICWGALISRSWVISVASCTKGKASKKLTIAVGFWDSDETQSRPVQTKFEHPEFDDENNVNDVVLLRLLFRITLYSVKKIDIGERRPEDLTDGRTILQSAEYCPWCSNEEIDLKTLDVVVHDSCSNPEFDKKSQLCVKATTKPSGSKSCRYGNEGIPLVIARRLYGLLSSGDICRQTALYTDLTKHHDFIANITKIRPKPKKTFSSAFKH